MDQTSSNSNINTALQHAAMLQRQGRIVDASSAYQRIIAADPGCHTAYHELGLMAFANGDLPLAIDWIKQARELDKSVAVYQRNYGEICRRSGSLTEAIMAGKCACELAPGDLNAHYNLGLAYSDAGDYTKAIEAYRLAIQINPEHGLAWNNMGSALEQQGSKDKAEAAYARAVSLNSRHAEAQNNLGAIYSEQGKLELARDCYEAALAANPEFVEAHYNLSSLKSYTKNDPHLDQLETIFANRNNLSEHARIRYCFALGKALDDIGEYDRAFAVYEEGNRLQHARHPGNEHLADAMVERIIQVFNHDFFKARQRWNIEQDRNKTPVFIVGMPRSGTTLLEQILCSHPSVYGAGELKDLHNVFSDMTGATQGLSLIEAAIGFSESEVHQLGKCYIERVWSHSPDSTYITDKMPANFFLLGLIHLALPNARIIHAMRDPMDSCFSCYTRLFNDTMEFAYDQGTLGRYYVRYMKLMRHWHQVLPAGSILDLSYEDMVANSETQARRVLDFLGLPWDANCLEFHKNERLVRTASMAQVRKPIYKTSLARWKHFAKHLDPLLNIVRDYHTTETVTDHRIPAAKQEQANPSATIRNCQELQAKGEHAAVLAKLTPLTTNGDAPADVWHLQGISLYRQEHFELAQHSYKQALKLKPDSAIVWNSLGFLLQDMGQPKQARRCFSRALALAPRFDMARLNLGLAQLKLGDWQSGWDNYEARWSGSMESQHGTFKRPSCPLPQWEGQIDITHQSLLIITEQGFGDTIQFSRYLLLAAQRFKRVGFVCSAPTFRLMQWSFGDKVAVFHKLPADFAGWHWQCPLMSLPRAFRTRPDTVPSSQSYLKVARKNLQQWRHRLDQSAPGRLRVGIAWAGRKTHQSNAHRSLMFRQLLPLLKTPDITWVCLQKWGSDESHHHLTEDIQWLDWTEECHDFADTAALLSNLDLVISVDSAMVHLAGALARPIWMLNRFNSEWRWMHRRTNSPWYPTLRIFNQPQFGDWHTVLQRVGSALSELSPGSRPLPRSRPTPSLMKDEVVSPKQALRLASQLQVAGRLQEAETLLCQILHDRPNDAHAMHLLGIIAFQSGNPDRARRFIEQAINDRPDVALFYSNLAEIYRQQGETTKAIACGKQALALAPELASAHSNLGIAHYDVGDYEQAETCHRQALSLVPTLVQSLNNFGSIQRARKDSAGALAWYQRVIDIEPDNLDSLSNIGAIMVEDDRPEEAGPVLEKALSLAGNHTGTLCNLGLVRIKQQRYDEAIRLLQRALQLKPDYPEAMLGLATALREKGALLEAKQLVSKVVATAPDNPSAYCQLGILCMELGETKQAQAAYRQALSLNPGNTEALTGLGNLCLESGKLDEAELLFRQAIAINPDNLGARFHLAQAKKIRPGDENLIALEARLQHADNLSTSKRISLNYALGKAYDDLKEYDKAFPHFLEGARLKRNTLNYQSDADDARIQHIIDTYDQAFFERLSGAGDESQMPIFVLGMPRSGTTLTEQIISSHPQVHGAGELPDLLGIVQQSDAGTSRPSYPGNLASLTREQVTHWGQKYTVRLHRHSPASSRITDKMPANYLALGLIPLMMPNAKIIHVKRNPVDTCLSCFTRLFNRHQHATYDLVELGRHYANYAGLMEHWRTVLPAGSFIEVQYEDIIADMEGQARRLIEYCGLEWHDDCLNFHNNTRTVRTASVTQVRQPIYRSSVERWRHYEAYLAPLLKALGKYAPEA